MSSMTAMMPAVRDVNWTTWERKRMASGRVTIAGGSNSHSRYLRVKVTRPDYKGTARASEDRRDCLSSISSGSLLPQRVPPVLVPLFGGFRGQVHPFADVFDVPSGEVGQRLR